ncbi:MAG: ubiquitin-like domain-containing protein [Bifidobacteriaceae bacterium]|nr:ubiquitin-like domain-containing protein [Bifidobacteriaceae bacterium]
MLALAAGGIAGFAAAHKTVTLTVDGESSVVTTFAWTVGGVLAAQDVAYTERDLVAPAPDAAVPRSGEIVVRTAQPIDLEIDGQQRTIWTTANTLDEALAAIGVRGEEAALSQARGTTVANLTGVVTVSTPKPLAVAVDGVTLETESTAADVRELLSQLGVVLGPDDQVSPALDASVAAGETVTVHRAQVETGREVTVIPFESVEEDAPTLPKGTKRVKTAGVAGQRVVIYAATIVDGAEVAREVVMEAVTVQPVTQVTLVGTMKVEVPTGVTVNVDPASAKGIARQMMADTYGWGDDEFACLVQLWTRESNWRVNAENRSSGAYGIPQSYPGNKMASAGDDWRTNPATQIKWGLGYIKDRYKTPCGAWSAFLSKGWY